MAQSPSVQEPESRINVDRVFDTCILLVTVLAAAEFAYVAYLFPASEMANLAQGNLVFRVTTTLILVLIVSWILISLIPSPPKNWSLGALGRFRRRFAKEFCWCLFGNLLVFEVFAFVFYSFFSGESSVAFTVYYTLFFAFFITLPATWQYSILDRKLNQKASKHPKLQWLVPIIEHVVIFLVSYWVVEQVILLSATVPLPVVPVG
jgi:hypothetical protein